MFSDNSSDSSEDSDDSFTATHDDDLKHLAFYNDNDVRSFLANQTDTWPSNVPIPSTRQAPGLAQSCLGAVGERRGDQGD